MHSSEIEPNKWRVLPEPRPSACCGQLLVQPDLVGDMPSEVTETVAAYDEIAADFVARWGDLRLERALGTFAKQVSGLRRVLDLGCGPGRDVDFLTGLGCHVVGLDLSAGMLGQARQRLPAASLIRGDLRRLPFGPRTFDGVWACASLLHLPHSQLSATLSELGCLLSYPHGVLYLALKGGQGERWVVGASGRRFFFAYYHPSEIEAALEQAGFVILEHWTSPDSAGRTEPWLSYVARVEVDQ